jgi:CRISPR/Cas system-associated exonuclease Cas4 (RecB family)
MGAPGCDDPRPGHPVRRDGKPYIWVTWIAKLLGGDECVWAAWFKAHYRYHKFDEQGQQLAGWDREHRALMRETRKRLEENGWTVKVESENAFKLAGKVATVAGKPDIVARMPGHILIVDGKTGRERDADWWQVLLYLFAYPLLDPNFPGHLEGRIEYRHGGKTVPFKQLTNARMGQIIDLIQAVGANTPPAKAPSRHECKRCNITAADCPERVDEDVPETPVSGF